MVSRCQSKLLLFLIPAMVMLLPSWGFSQVGIDNLFFNSNNNITALGFSTTPPSITYTGIGGGFEGIAHVEDGNGNIRFFVNATGVYRYPSGVLMPGSAGIFANTSSAEMVTCPVPGQPNRYYVIYNAQTCSPLYYCIVDLTLAAGQGDVVPGTLNTVISNSQYSEGIEIVRQTSPCDSIQSFWLLAYECGVQFTRWTIDVTGIGNQTNVLAWASGTGYDGRGELDYHAGKVGLACTYTPNSVLTSFNPVTGVMTNPINIVTPGTGFAAGSYGVEFSPDGTKAYFTDWYNSTGTDNLFIYDYTTGLRTDTLIPTLGSGLGEIEMGKDGKLYIIMYNSNVITVIQNPNDPPQALVWTNTTLAAGVTMGLGITDHIQSDFYAIPSLADQSICVTQPTWLYAASFLDSITWRDSNNVIVSTIDSFFAPASPMLYNIIAKDTCSRAIVSYNIYVGFVDSTLIVSDDSICNGQSITLSAGQAHTYSWAPAGGLSCPTCQVTTASPTATTTYFLTVEDTVANCSWTDSVRVVVSPQPTAVIDPETDQCEDGNLFNFTQSGVYTSNATFNWTFPTGNPGASTLETPGAVTYASVGSKFVTLQVDEGAGCISNIDTIFFNVNPDPVANIVTTQDTFCAGESATLNAGSGASYAWSPAIGLSCTNCQAPTVTPPTSMMYYVTVTNPTTGCTEEDSIYLHVWPVPIASINSVADQCFAGNSFDFTQNGIYGTSASFFWEFPSGTPATSNLENPTGITFGTSGPKYATLFIEENGCISPTDTVFFEVFPMPDASFTASTGAQCFNGHSFDLTSTGTVGAGVNHFWTFQDGLSPNSFSQNPIGVTFTSPGWKEITHQVTQNGCVTILTDSVLVYADPVIDAGPDVSFCEGDSGAMLQGQLLFSNTTVNWHAWSCNLTMATFCGLDTINDLDPIALPDASTWYYLQTTDNNGCVSNIDSAFVTVLPKPIVNAGPDQFICADSAPGVILNPTVTGAPGPFHYQWSPATGLNNDTLQNPYARPDTTTIYTLTVQSQNGCYSENTTVDTLSTVIVHVQPLPVADAGPDRDLCLGDSLMLQGFGYNAGPAYNFQWSPATGLSSTTIANPMAGPSLTIEYILTVISNGCPSYGDTVRVDVHTNPTANAGGPIDICLGESTTLNGFASGDSTATYTYSWTPVESLDDPTSATPVATPDTTTTYTLVATSNYGCESPPVTVQVVVKPTPVAEAGPQATICLGDSVQLAGSYSYTTTPPANPTEVYYAWTPSNGLMSDSTVQNPWVNPAQTQFYYLEVRHNTCSTLDSVLVTVLPDLGATASADTSTICEGESVQLTAAGGLGGADFQWFPSTGLDDPKSPNPVATPNQSTVYSVILEEGGCIDTVEVPVAVLPTPDMAYLSSVRRGCPEFTVNFLDASANITHWIWNFGDGEISNEQNPVHTYTQPGSYIVTLTGINAGGCKASVRDMEIQVVNPPNADFTTDPMIPVELALPNTAVQFLDQSTNGTAWRWQFGDGNESSEQNPVYSYTQPGEYMATLTVTTPEGCQSVTQHGPIIVYTPDLFIPNVFSPNSDGINDGFQVNYTGSQPFNMAVYDRWGAMLFQTTNKNAPWMGVDDDGNSVPEGVYFYRVSIGGKEYSGDVSLLR